MFLYQAMMLLKIEALYAKHHIGYAISIVLSFALVVFISSSMFAIRDGVNETVERSKQPGLFFAIDKRADSEIVSRLSKQDRFALRESLQQQQPSFAEAISSEFSTLVNLPMGEVTLRGVTSEAFEISPKIVITQGRVFSSDRNEVIVGNRLLRHSSGIAVGKSISINGTQWLIVGSFTSSVAVKESEILADIRQVHGSFDLHDVYSVFTFNWGQDNTDEQLADLANDRPFKVVSSEDFYAGSGRYLISFVDYIGSGLSIITLFGVVIGIASICYSQLINRSHDLRVSHVIGFGASVRWAFIIANTIQALVGALLGLMLAYLVTYDMTLSTLDSGKQLIFEVNPSLNSLGIIMFSCVVTALIANFIVIHKALKYESR